MVSPEIRRLEQGGKVSCFGANCGVARLNPLDATIARPPHRRNNTMTLDRKLLEILVCPVTKQPVFPLDQTRLDKVNQLIAQGKLHTHAGDKLKTPLQQALITRNGNTIYRVEEGVPVMLEGESVACEQIGDW